MQSIVLNGPLNCYKHEIIKANHHHIKIASGSSINQTAVGMLAITFSKSSEEGVQTSDSLGVPGAGLNWNVYTSTYKWLQYTHRQFLFDVEFSFCISTQYVDFYEDGGYKFDWTNIHAKKASKRK